MQAERASRPVWAVLAVLLCAHASAEEPKHANDINAELPSLELLEFLGEWETKDGDWMDPSSLLLDSDIGTKQ